MNSNKIRPEWIPSGYKEVNKAEQVEKVKADRMKSAFYNRKDVFIRQGFKRANLK